MVRPPVPEMLAAALAWYDAGCSVVPVRADGSKAPAVRWRPFQSRRAGPAQLRAWFAGNRPGVGVVCGAVSGGLEMLELEGRAMIEGVVPRLLDLVATTGLGEVWRRVARNGYAERTPTGGVHLLYRVAGGTVPGNTRLARRPATGTELAADPMDRVKTLIETRGEGGFVVVAPSHGTVHPSGRAWTALLGGTPDRIPTLSRAERDALVDVMRALDAVPEAPPRVPVPRRPGAGPYPGDEFEARTDWADILMPAGWQPVYAIGGTRYWRRPGKSFGISATTGWAQERDRLYVFSTSTLFPAQVPITKFHAYAVLYHDGDHHRAAVTLRRAGFVPDP